MTTPQHILFNPKSLLCIGAWVVFLFCLPLGVHSASEYEAITEQLKQLQAQLDSAMQEGKTDHALRQGLFLRTYSMSCVNEQGKKLAQLSTAIHQETAIDTFTPVIQQIETDKQIIARLVRFCSTVNEKSDQLVLQLTKQSQIALKNHLLTKRANVLVLVSEFKPKGWKWVRFNRGESSFPEIKSAEFVSFAIILIFSMGFSIWIRHRSKRNDKAPETANSAQSSNQLLRQALARSAPYWFPLYSCTFLAFAQSDYDLVYPVNLVLVLASAFISLGILLQWLDKICALNLPDLQAHLPNISLLSVLCLVALSYVLFGSGLVEFQSTEIMQLTHVLLYSITFVFLFLSVRRLAQLFSGFSAYASLFNFSTGIIVLLWLAECVGFHNLVQYLLYGFTGSLAVFALYFVARVMIRDALNYLESGQHRYLSKLRGLMGIEGDASWPGMLWIRFFLTLMVFGITAFALMVIWDLSSTGYAFAFDILVDGFSLGKYNLSPIKILMAILLVALLFMASRALQQAVRVSLIGNRSLDTSGREAITTLVGYLGIGTALLLGLSTAGFDLTSLAFVAGALSLGVGFGLQNIVNNFVSGIILLFERPVRRGDWIRVGTTEGRVREIKVRSTEIRTFDGADVVVPNAELISQQVTNMTLRDVHGRVIVAVGVAYGSDVQLVKKLLHEIADAENRVLKSIHEKLPVVLFRGFGDSALLFELRVFISDVSRILVVQSDLNFAIDQKFREANIQIPFPQRDVHIISQPSSDLNVS